jgi:large subunit ribosomal protein L24
MKKNKEIKKMRIKKGDNVVVISGEYKGVHGKVLKAFPKQQKVIVEKVNFIKKHTKASNKNPQGGVIEQEAPIQVSNVMLWNDKIKDVSRAVYKKIGDKRVRVYQKTGDEV